MDFLTSGIYEAISGNFAVAYVNRKIFPSAGKVFLRNRYRPWAALSGRQI
jgi:hypothetical protein